MHAICHALSPGMLLQYMVSLDTSCPNNLEGQDMLQDHNIDEASSVVLWFLIEIEKMRNLAGGLGESAAPPPKIA